jgi:hypothetical protein
VYAFVCVYILIYEGALPSRLTAHSPRLLGETARCVEYSESSHSPSPLGGDTRADAESTRRRCALRPPCVRCCRCSVADVFDTLSESAHSGALDGRSRTSVVAGVLAAASGRPPLRSKGPFGATVAATMAGHWPFPHNHPSRDPTRAYRPLLPPKLYSGLCTEACVFAQAA